MRLWFRRQRRLSQRIAALQQRMAVRRAAINQQQAEITAGVALVLSSPLALLLAAVGGVLLERRGHLSAAADTPPTAPAPPAVAHPLANAAALIHALSALLISLQPANDSRAGTEHATAKAAAKTTEPAEQAGGTTANSPCTCTCT